MTHNYNYDLAVLRQLIVKNVQYIGILGSRNKLARMLDDLSSDGGNIEKALSKIYSPVGLDIGAETPEEIALSITSEIQAVLSGRSVNHLRRLNSQRAPASESKNSF